MTATRSPSVPVIWLLHAYGLVCSQQLQGLSNVVSDSPDSALMQLPPRNTEHCLQTSIARDLNKSSPMEQIHAWDTTWFFVTG